MKMSFQRTPEEQHLYLAARAAGMELALQYLWTNGHRVAAESFASSLTFRVARAAASAKPEQMQKVLEVVRGVQ
jgi:hypothetical protein